MLMLERYKGMTCRVDFKAPNSEEGYEFHGTILSTQHVEMPVLPGPSLAELEQQFKAAVDAYLEMEPTLPVVCDIGAPAEDWPGYMHTCDLVYHQTKVGKLTRLYDGKVTAHIGAYNNMSPVFFIGDTKKDVTIQVKQHFIELEEQQRKAIDELTALQPLVTGDAFRYMVYGYTMWLLQSDQSLDTAVQRIVDETPIDDLLNPTSKIDQPAQQCTVRQWLQKLRPEAAELLEAWGYKHCVVTIGGSRFKLAFDDPPYPWVMPANGFAGFDRQLDTIKPCIVTEKSDWPFMSQLHEFSRLELDTPFTLLNAGFEN